MRFDSHSYNHKRTEFKKNCTTGKVKFFTKQSAIAYDDIKGDGLFPYKCDLCGFYHLTKQRPK